METFQEDRDAGVISLFPRVLFLSTTGRKLGCFLFPPLCILMCDLELKVWECVTKIDSHLYTPELRTAVSLAASKQ